MIRYAVMVSWMELTELVSWMAEEWMGNSKGLTLDSPMGISWGMKWWENVMVYLTKNILP